MSWWRKVKKSIKEFYMSSIFNYKLDLFSCKISHQDFSVWEGL